MLFESAFPLNGIIIIVYHCLSFHNMLGAAEDIKKTQFLPWGLHSDRQTNKMYLREGRLIAEMQFPRCLYLCFGFVCLSTSCGLKKSPNFPAEQEHKWQEFRREHEPCRAEHRAEHPDNLILGISVSLNCPFPFCLSLQFKLHVASSLETKSLI